MSYILKHKRGDSVYAYNESTDDITAIGKIVNVNAEAGTYTIEDIAWKYGEDVKVFHTCVYKVGTGPLMVKQKKERGLIEKLDELNPKAYDNIREIVKAEFQFLAQHMLDNADEYFYDEVEHDTDDPEEIEIVESWLRDQVSTAITDVIKTFKSQL